jgi:hypothetical protein
LLYKKERPIGEYINSLVSVLFFFIVYDIIDGFSEYFNVELPKISQFILSIILISINILLIRKLRQCHSEFGKFYERFIFDDLKLDLKIIKKESSITKFIRRFRKYFSNFPNRFFFILLMMISSILFIYFFPEGYEKRILMTLAISASLYIVYLNFLYNRKLKMDNLK